MLSAATPRERRRFIVALVLFLAGGWWLTKPDYLVIDVPAPKHLGGGAFWDDVQLTEQRFDDAAGVYYIRRMSGRAYPYAQHWKTAEEVLSYFDAWMQERGWDSAAVTVSNFELPESHFLGVVKAKRYYHESEGYAPTEDAQVAVWPIGNNVEGFNVVFVTSRRSWLNKLQRDFD